MKEHLKHIAHLDILLGFTHILLFWRERPPLLLLVCTCGCICNTPDFHQTNGYSSNMATLVNELYWTRSFSSSTFIKVLTPPCCTCESQISFPQLVLFNVHRTMNKCFINPSVFVICDLSVYQRRLVKSHHPPCFC